MKTLYLIGGTMGVGKTTVCRLLKEKLNDSVFLDGDWCWDADPSKITDEKKIMVLENICFLLNQYIRCNAYENIVFCWVMHEQSIIDAVVSGIDKENCSIKEISLLCGEETLKARLEKDIKDGVRTEDITARSVDRLSNYTRLKTVKIDTDNKPPEAVASEIAAL